MTNSPVYSTSTSDRCDAKNKLTCRVHGVAGDFQNVPAIVEENIDRYRSLREHTDDNKAALVGYAKDLGIEKFSDIGYVTNGVVDTVKMDGKDVKLTAEQIDGLKNLEQEYDEAAVEEEDEQTYQQVAVMNFVRHQIAEAYPHKSEAEQFQLGWLVGGRFIGVEDNHPNDEEFGYRNLEYSNVKQQQMGPTRAEMFAPLHDHEVRAKLTELDRGYFTALSGRIPTEAELGELAAMRNARLQGIVSDTEKDATFKLVSDLSAVD